MKHLTICLALAIAPLAHGEVLPVEVEDLHTLLDRGVPMVDVRTPAEWQDTGVVEGSQLLSYFDPQGRANPDAYMQKFAAIAGPDDEVILICRTGERSTKVAKYLDAEQKYRKVYVIQGGVIGWKALGNPIIRPAP